MEPESSLMSISKGSGCGCKIQPAVLSEMLSGVRLNTQLFPNLIVGNAQNDDCSVYDLGDQYLLQTVDFFTPMVNDPTIFGKAAAANALSDIYAMGGKPIMANAVFSWPLDKLPINEGQQVLQAGADLCAALGVAFAGGHSIDGQDPLFGLSVTGLVKKSNLKTNAGAKIGDIICMTKPLGIGMLAAATKRKIASDEQRNELNELLTQTNDIGEDLGAISGISAMTDITGFGLLGHLLELCKASEVGATVEFGKLPLANAARSLAASYVLPDNAMRNWNAYEKECELQNMEAFTWVVDPQTNGGLLFTVSPDALQEVRNVFELREKALYEVGLITSKGVIMV